MAKKILFFQWNAYMQEGIEAAMKRQGMEYDVLYYEMTRESWNRNAEFEQVLEERLDAGEYDTIFSVNFCPVVSDVCAHRRIHYISWVYDAPIHITRTETIGSPYNDVYFFDRAQCETYRDKGALTAHHLTLASDPDLFSEEGIRNTIEKRKAGMARGIVTSPAAEGYYDCDVSLVGQLYKSQYPIIYTPLDDYYRGYMEGIVYAQQNIKGGYILDDMFTDELVEKLNEFYVKYEVDHNKVSKKKIVYAVGTEITGRERYTILALLQRRCNVNLYSGDTDERLDKVNFKGMVDYETQMPEVFRHSRINLNISLSMIQSGIPMRVLDVLACGGFLLTNYQPEIAEYFENGRELVIYEDYVDLVQKVRYYLAHDEERKEIARNGQQAVRERFNFDDRVKTMFGI
jgi:spore maturation protein CgeB